LLLLLINYLSSKPYTLTLSLCLYVCVTHSVSHSLAISSNRERPLLQSHFQTAPSTSPSYQASLSSFPSLSLYHVITTLLQSSPSTTLPIFRILLLFLSLSLSRSLDPDPLLNPPSGFLFSLGVRSLSSANHPLSFHSLLASLVVTVYIFMAF